MSFAEVGQCAILVTQNICVWGRLLHPHYQQFPEQLRLMSVMKEKLQHGGVEARRVDFLIAKALPALE